MSCSRVTILCAAVIVTIFNSSMAVAKGPTGACCYVNGVCGEMFTEADCTGSGGTYQGDGVQCTIGCDCDVDIDGSGIINFADVIAVLSAYGTMCGGCPEDIDGNGTVGARDLLLVFYFFGESCGGTIVSLDIRPAPTVTFENVSLEVGTPCGLVTWRAVAHLDPLDGLFAVVGPLNFSTDDPLGIANFGGPFTGMTQEDFPPDGPPDAEFYDSFITIGRTSGGVGDLQFTPVFAGGAVPAIAGTSFSDAEGGWFEPAPFAAGPDVPIAQFTVQEGSAIDFDGVLMRQTGQPGPRFDSFAVSVARFVIQDAIVAALPGEEVVIPPGVYHETLNLLGKAITLRPEVPGTVTVDGSCDGGSVITCNSGEGSDTIIDGLIITGGSATGDGGGMFVDGSSPTIRNCVFDANVAGRGDGLFLHASQSLVEDCVFTNNGLGGGNLGAGLAATQSEFTLTRCDIFGNEAFLAGGMFLFESDCTMTDCRFRNNHAGIGIGVLDWSVWNQGRLILHGDNEISPEFPDDALTYGYVQFPTPDTSGAEPDSGALVYEVGPAGEVGTLTVRAGIYLNGELEVDYGGFPNPPMETAPILVFGPTDDFEVVETWEVTDTCGLPLDLTAAPFFGGGTITTVTMRTEPAEGSQIQFAPPEPTAAAGQTVAFDFVNVNPDAPGEVLDDFLTIADAGAFTGVALHLNNGAGFGGPVFLDTGGNDVDRFTVADFDCDGSLDVAAYQRYGSPQNVYVLLNDGLGNFTPLAGGPLVFPAGTSNGYDSVIAYERDGDGDMDLLGFRVDDFGGGNVIAVIAPNDPCGSFVGAMEESSLVRPFVGPLELNATLLDTVSGADRAAIYMKASGGDQFAVVTLSFFGFPGTISASGIADNSVDEYAVSVDLNEDGEPDYILANVVLTPIDASRGRINVMDGGGGTNLGPFVALNPDIALDIDGVAFGIDAADVDGDGDIDITVGFEPFSGPDPKVFRTYTGEPPVASRSRLNFHAENDVTADVDAQAFKFASTVPVDTLKAINVLCGPDIGEFTEVVRAGEFCSGDLNNDRCVTFTDITIALTNYFEPTGGILQLLSVLSGWGPCGARGACCLPDGDCLDCVTLNECLGANGDYRGDGSLCLDENCPPP